MTDDELKNWFWDKFNSCYEYESVEYPTIKFLFYDKNFIRKQKFAILQGKEIKHPTKPSGVCLFMYGTKGSYLDCDYEHIWEFFESNTNLNYIEVRKLTKNFLIDSKLKKFIPIDFNLSPKYFKRYYPLIEFDYV